MSQQQDTVNVSGQDAANKALGTRVLVSDLIAQHLAPGHCRPLGRFQLSGKRQAVGLADPLVHGDTALCEQHARALAAWERGDLGAAQALARAVLERWPHDGPTRFLLQQATPAGPQAAAGISSEDERKIFELPLK